jgi:hypothetical protein
MTRPLIRTLLSTIGVLAVATHLIAQPPAPPPAQPPPLTDRDLEQAAAAGPQGTLAVRAVQGTKGAPAVGVAEIELVLYHRDQPVWQMKSALDEHGVVVIDKIPIVMNVRPVVRIKYAGVLYQDVGPPMDAQHPTASVDVTVYETTDDSPAWHVSMRHVVATRADAAYNVAETVVVENPADKTWLGAPPDAQARRATVVLTLPENAADVHLEAGFHGWCCTAVASRDLLIQMPLMPGKATYRFSYRVPVAAGNVSLCVGAPAPIDHAMFMVPDDASAAEPVLTTAGASQAVGPARVRVFNATAVPAGENAGIRLSGLVTTTQLVAATESTSHVKTIAAIAAGALLVVGVGVIILKSKKRAGAW